MRRSFLRSMMNRVWQQNANGKGARSLMGRARGVRWTGALILAAASVSALSAGQSSGTAAGADPAGFVLWKDARLREAADRLYQRIGDKRLVFETIGNWQGHSVYLVLRGTTDDPEFHDTEEDLFVAQRGKATLVTGGDLVDERSLPRKQRRGSSILGGTRRELEPGDIVHIPQAIAHQLLIPPGQSFLYILIKFDEEPLLKR